MENYNNDQVDYLIKTVQERTDLSPERKQRFIDTYETLRPVNKPSVADNILDWSANAGKPYPVKMQGEKPQDQAVKKSIESWSKKRNF